MAVKGMNDILPPESARWEWLEAKVRDLMARYAFSENNSLTFNANNVTDEKYINSLYWAQGFYGAPANYSATLSWKL